MAKIFYELKKNINEDSAAFGKYYAYARSIETMNTRKLAQHISEHGSLYTSDVVFGVMEKFRSCLIEMLLESKRVKIDGLGIFYCTLENAVGGAVSPEKFNVQKNLTALHIRFMPEQEQEMNISSREFIKKAEFINIATLLKGEEPATTNGTGAENENDGSTSSPQEDENGGETTNGTNNSNEGGSNSGSQGGSGGNSGGTQSGGTQSGGDNSSSNSGSGDNQGGNGGDDENIDEGII